MYPSAALCRTQQALQLDRAAAATLGNVRSIAERAAAAWGAEADLADSRERRHAKAALLRDADRSARALSENPDRGFAEA